MFRDNFTKLGKLNGEVYGITPPSSESSTVKFTGSHQCSCDHPATGPAPAAQASYA